MVGNSDPGLQWVGSVACSGAQASAVSTSYKGQPSQADALRSYASRTSVVTVTMGGNDIGFASILGQCLLVDCWRTGKISTAQRAIANSLPSALQVAYLGIRLADTDARVVVVGYPRLFSQSQAATTGCGWLTQTERMKLNDLAVQLDTAIKTAAHASGFDYVSTLNALNGHELCTADSWVFPVLYGVGGSMQGHPLYRGQRAIAAFVRNYMASHGID